MARPKTASKILELKGSFKKHPERKRQAEPEGREVFSRAPPDQLSGYQQECWREIIKAIPAGVLTGSDLIHVEVVARLLAELRTKGDEMRTERITRLTQEMGRLGLNPSARASLSVEKPKTNKYADE